MTSFKFTLWKRKHKEQSRRKGCHIPDLTVTRGHSRRQSRLPPPTLEPGKRDEKLVCDRFNTIRHVDYCSCELACKLRLTI
jgi:hypothetical protein